MIDFFRPPANLAELLTRAEAGPRQALRAAEERALALAKSGEFSPLRTVEALLRNRAALPPTVAEIMNARSREVEAIEALRRTPAAARPLGETTFRGPAERG